MRGSFRAEALLTNEHDPPKHTVWEDRRNFRALGCFACVAGLVTNMILLCFSLSLFCLAGRRPTTQRPPSSWGAKPGSAPSPALFHPPYFFYTPSLRLSWRNGRSNSPPVALRIALSTHQADFNAVASQRSPSEDCKVFSFILKRLG